MSLTPQWLDELRARTILSALIGRSVKVTRAGREWKACCPFHNEKTPSFTINDDKGFYHCFGCGAHGDAIRWMTDQRGLPFLDAVKELAAAAGMEVPAPDPKAARRAEQATTLRDVVEASARWFQERLADAEGEPARTYLAKRGLDSATITAFGIGYAPDARGRLREVLKPFGEPLAIEAGMLIQPPVDAPAPPRAGLPAGKATQKREPYDRFRGRLMIPIRDVRGRVIAFGGRILGAGEPKYLNSPDTPLFDKGRVLFNLDRAAAAARHSRRLIVVEGYMDVIALAQAGFGEAVAPLGTALTEAQLDLAWRQVPVPVLAFDGDAAGQRAALRAAERALPLLRPGHSLAFALLPPGQDPDDLVRSGGSAAIERLIEEAIPLVEFLWRIARGEQASETPEARAAVKARLMDWAEQIADKDVAALYRDEFRQRFGDAYFNRQGQRATQPVQRGAYQSRSNAQRSWKAPPPMPGSATIAQSQQPIDRPLVEAVIGGLLRFPQLIAPRADRIARLTALDPVTARLLDAMVDAAFAHQGLDSAHLLTILGDAEVYNKAVDLLRADRVRFSFSQPMDVTSGTTTAVPAPVMRDLDEVLDAIAAWPEIERACADADRQVQERLDEESWQAQRHWHGLRDGLRQRLMDIAENGSANAL